MTPTKKTEVVEVASSEEVNPAPNHIIADYLTRWMSQGEAEMAAGELVIKLRKVGVVNG